MPHQPVIREDKETTKLRIVYDASSKMENASLNECLEVPEAFFTDMFAVLIRFRIYKVAVIADIEKAFLSIGMKEGDRNALRLLWVDDPYSEVPNIIKMRLTRVVFGVGPSMWHLGATISNHIEKYEASHPNAVKKIEEGLYADDLSSGEDDTKKAIKLYNEAKNIFKQGGFNLRKWKSNSCEVMDAINSAEGRNDSLQHSESHAKMMLNPSDASDVKVLGIPWDVKFDKMIFSLEGATAKMDPENMSKKEFLGAASSVFDPPGILSPVVVPLKIMFQKLCKDGGTWNDKLQLDVKEDLKQWLKNSEKLQS